MEKEVIKDVNERSSDSESPPTPPELAVGFDAKATKRLLRKIDFTLIPFLSLLYLYVKHPPVILPAHSHVIISLSFLDRSNIGNARLVGLEDSLGMTGLDYNVVLE